MIYNYEDKKISINFQEAKTMSIFRDGFELEKKPTDYLKLEKGENRIRILSRFIDGWVEWKDQGGVRKVARHKNRPEVISPECKQFVAAIVWNYNCGRIQIMELTQASIIKKLDEYARDEEYGPIFFYDLRIVRSGDGMLTKYDVKPSQKKDLAAEIEKAFRARPCYLEALYSNDDPFGPWEKSTPGIFRPEDGAAPVAAKITPEQVARLKELLDGNADYEASFKVKLMKAFGSDRYEDIPASQYSRILDSIFESFDRKAIA